MPNGNDPDLKDIWTVINEARRELAELRGMLNIHFSDQNIHHHPPCHPAEEIRKTMLSAAGAAILALLAAIGSIVANVVR
ncbi:MAG: hypothetical protein WC082_12580 [Victivallales bacterium]